MDIQALKSSFRKIFEAEPVLIKSPGRINIIGEHTDYNDGFVMPAAINKAIYVAVSQRDDQEIHLYSESYQQKHVASIDQIEKTDKSWANYILGVADQIKKRGLQFSGFNLYLDGNVPLGAGLSSSAALECATAFAIKYLNNLDIPQMDLALISQKAEHEFAGVNCGIMDQFASVFGKKDQAVMLDCRSMKYEYIPLKLDGYKLVLLNTNVKHSLADSAYNERRSQCEQGVAWIKEHEPTVNSLRDVNLELLEKHVKPKDSQVYQKCAFVVKEIDRVVTAADQSDVCHA
jgi:galactokinase